MADVGAILSRAFAGIAESVHAAMTPAAVDADDALDDGRHPMLQAIERRRRQASAGPGKPRRAPRQIGPRRSR
jgi:hypothetical protein